MASAPVVTTGAAAVAPYSAVVLRDLDGVGFYSAPHAPAEAWEAPATTITLTEPTAGSLVIKAGTSTLVARLTTGDGTPLSVGALPLRPTETLTAGTVNLHVSDDATRNNDFASGTVTVRELVRDTAGVITAFAADVEGSAADHDSWSKGPRTMQLRYRSALGYTALRSSASAYMGSSSLGIPTSPLTLTMTVLGTQPIRFGAAYADIDPSPAVDPGPFEVASDGCNGRQLAPGQSCSVSVRALPESTEQIDGHFVIPDNTTSSRTSIRTASMGTVDRTGRYQQVNPTRLYDSRSARAFSAGETRRIKVAGRAGVPNSYGFSVALSVTAVSPSADGYLTVFHQLRPDSSNVNFRKATTRANLATSIVWEDGTVAVYSSAATHVLVDVVGYFDPPTTDGSQLEPIEPSRVLDTRYDPAGAFAPGEIADVALDFGPDTNPAVTGVVVNLTAVAPKGSGYLTAWTGDTAPPTVSSLNFTPGSTVPVLAFVPTSHLDDGSVVFSLKNGSAGATHVLADVVGYFDDTAVEGVRFFPTGGERLLDTRIGKGLAGPFGARQTRDVKIGSVWYKHADTVGALLNVAAVRPTTSTYLTVWDRLPGEAPPNVSNLNPRAGDLVANAALTFLTPTDTFGIFNSNGSTHVLADVLGVWDLYPGSRGVSGASSPTAARADVTLKPSVSRD
ncbi:hypothetical protein N803_15670 [Knoellia subterranea KCTC 19937]|uniref:Uncharacterized protein n=1 Tax=Knoellia subterranea KCTC 19937 TaxID=1385521 RepID=A0A0A0JIR7_9MICO|nr:hypothetical protein N803_15670 [Knoellia subterranea KCTC 19937]